MVQREDFEVTLPGALRGPDGNEEERAGTISLFEGAVPEVVKVTASCTSIWQLKSVAPVDSASLLDPFRSLLAAQKFPATLSRGFIRKWLR